VTNGCSNGTTTATHRLAEIRIISVRQPWAHLIVTGVKRIENRTWSTRWRGPVLVHAALRAAETPVEQIEQKFGVAIPRDLPSGGVKGLAGLADVVTGSDDRYFEGPFGFVMVGARPLPFMPGAGALGLRTVPARLVERVKPRLIADIAVAVEAYRPEPSWIRFSNRPASKTKQGS
jgi:hypothetical protein